jgi:2-polyprenyl-3-methyl-5-hydroxy-6-metoxy-1,4-benzoquinol methylase
MIGMVKSLGLVLKIQTYGANMPNSDFYDIKWRDLIKKLPDGGQYRYDLRSFGYKQINLNIKPYSKVFDYGCGLGIHSAMLKEAGCTVAGCDISQVAVDYCNKSMGVSSFYKGEDIRGKHDVIIADYFLEHIPDPVKWLKDALKCAPKVICSIPNDFRKVGEHKDMAWGSWDDFNTLFSTFKWKRIDNYPADLCKAFKHPIIVFESKKGVTKPTKEVKKPSKSIKKRKFFQINEKELH